MVFLFKMTKINELVFGRGRPLTHINLENVAFRVISGHTGWVRCVDVEPGNEWFATGGADRIVKVCF